MAATPPLERGQTVRFPTPLPENFLSAFRPAFVKWALSAAIGAVAMSAAASANAEVNVSVGVGGPVYYGPAPVYQAPPPVYYQPAPPVYYQPAPPPPSYYAPQPGYYVQQPGYYAPAPGFRGRDRGDWHGQARTEQPKLNDMQRRAMDNCSLLAYREQPRCRASVMSTVR